MGKQAQLLEFYEQVLASVSVYPDEDGLLSLYIPAEDGDWTSTPCTFNDKRLALPNRQILKEADWDEILPFHPLSEHLLKGESEVLKLTKRLVLFRLRQTTQVLMTQLMHIAADPEIQKQLKPDQAKFLQQIPQANDKSVAALGKLLDKQFDKIVSIYLKRKGMVEGAEMRRAAKISFPIYAELKTKGTKVLDVDLGSAKVKKQIAALFEFVFDINEEDDGYIVGSNSNEAPYFHALMHAHYIIGKKLNSLVHKYRKFIDNHEQFKIDLHYIDDIEHLEQWKDIIPQLPGNKGAKGKDESEEEEAGHRAPPKVDPMQRVGNRAKVEPEEEDAPVPSRKMSDATPGTVPVANDAAGQPAPAASAAPKSSSGGISWRSVMQSQQPHQQMGGYGQQHGSPFVLSPKPSMGPPQPQPGYGNPMQMGGGYPGYGQPQPMYGQPSYGQPGGGFGPPMGQQPPGQSFPRAGGGGRGGTL